jgi:glycerol dehydrogenase-like iron-containing ADH family enzyme
MLIILAKAWGTPLYEIKARAAELSIFEILEIIEYEAMTMLNGESVYNFIFKEDYLEAEQKKKELEQINEMLKSAQSPEKKKEILKRLN